MTNCGYGEKYYSIVGENMVDIKEKFEKILVWENSSEVLNFKFQYSDILMWPLIRAKFYGSILYDYDYIAHKSTNSRNNNKIRLMSEIGKKIHELTHISRGINRDILFITFAVNHYYKEDNKYRNRVCDTFAMLNPGDTIFLENEWGRGERYLDKSINFNILRIKEGFNRFKSVSKTDMETINSFIDYLNNNFPYIPPKGIFDDIRNELVYYAKSNKIIAGFYRHIFRRVKPKVIFMPEACYGTSRAIATFWAKKENIPVLELQHGAIFKHHYAYNYPHLIYESMCYRNYLPDVLLTFGEYWNSEVRMPVPTKVLGSADFSYNYEKLKDKIKRVKKCILIILTDQNERMISLLKYLLTILDENYSFIIKGHPNYIHLLQPFYEIKAKYNRIEVIERENVYVCLHKAEFAIGDKSTTLYEAEGVGCKTIIYNYDNIADNIVSTRLGKWGTQKEEILDLIISEDWENKQNKPEFFSLSYKENYENILSTYVK